MTKMAEYRDFSKSKKRYTAFATVYDVIIGEKLVEFLL